MAIFILIAGVRQLDLQTVVNLGVGVGVPFVGWLSFRFHELQKELNEFRVTVATEYATNAELTAINQKLDRILERMSEQR